MAELPAITSLTREAIFSAYEADTRDGFRTHLGASLIGKECERALWYDFRWATKAKFPGRVLRLFETGNREEDRLVGNLRRTGATVLELDPETGRQFRVQAHGGHFGGSLDDCERALKLDPKFVKALNRKALCQFAVKEYHKALDTFRQALALEPDNEDSKTGIRQVAAKIAETSGGGIAGGGAMGGGVGWDAGGNGFSLDSMRRTLLTLARAGKRVPAVEIERGASQFLATRRLSAPARNPDPNLAPPPVPRSGAGLGSGLRAGGAAQPRLVPHSVCKKLSCAPTFNSPPPAPRATRRRGVGRRTSSDCPEP